MELGKIPLPSLRDGWALIRIRAFGLNRSEWFTRRGESPSVQFPRVLGIECVGEASDITRAQLQGYVPLVESGELALKLGPSFRFEMLREAHTLMDENRANGKMVIEVG